VSFKKTARQELAIKKLISPAQHIMLFGGSRSGKTFILVYAVIVRALKCKSRHLIIRLNFNAIKTSIWLDTLPKVLALCFPDLKAHPNKTDYYYTLPNGSEIWIAGLDNKERIEKILGKEYSTIYYNECSQIPLTSIEVATTRLAEKSDLKKKAYYDENPPNKRHWSYWIYIKGIDPDTGEPVKAGKYNSLIMNPKDNVENIDEGYITDILSGLSEKNRARFEHGEFTDEGEGSVYYSFDRDRNVRDLNGMTINGSTLIGMDFNVNPMTAVIATYSNDVFYILDEVFDPNSNTPKMCSELIKKGHKGANIYPDSTGANRKTSGRSDHGMLNDAGFTVQPTRNPIVFDRVNNVNRLLGEGRIIISPKCKKLINDLEKVVWKGVDLDQSTDKMLTHISDALGYLCWSLAPMGYIPNKPITGF